MIYFFKKQKNKILWNKKNYRGGYAMLVSVIFFTFLSLSIIAGLVSPSVREFKMSSDFIKSRQSFFLSESGVEDAYYRLKTSKMIGDSTLITLSGNTATTSIADSGYNEKTISSMGDVFLRQRKNEIKITTGMGVNFAYGIQAGSGGFVIHENAGVNGNVYSNSNIIGDNHSFVSGSAFAAGPLAVIDNVDIGENSIGDANAHEVKNSTIVGNLYCKIGSNNDGKSCDTSLSDPPIVDFPITQEMIDQWKIDAELGGTFLGNKTISSPASLGPKKITGDLNINANLTITGTIYVVGRITTSNNVDIKLDSSYGDTGGILLTDGRVELNNNVEFFGYGSNSYIMLVSTSSCPTNCSNEPAVKIENNVGAIIVNAQNGTVHMSNNVTLNEVVGKTIIMDNGAIVNYLSGLANTSFSSGPTGGWDIKSWREK